MFDPAKAEQVLERIQDGQSLRQAVIPAGIKHPTFLKWADENPSIGDQYTRAIAGRAEVHAERIEAVVDQVARGELAPDQARVMVDALKWTASKLNPRRYGDKLQLDADVRLQVELIDATQRPHVAQVIAQTAIAAAHKDAEDPS